MRQRVIDVAVRGPHLEFVPILAAGLVILAAKLLLIKNLGANVPFWDQWDAEAALLYKPYLEGTLSWDQLFASHNEHRILFSRLWSLALLELNGGWLPKLQMAANAVLHATILGLLLLWLTRGLGMAQRLFLSALTAAVYAIPFGWGNTLAGFQSQFYFVFGFSMATLWAFATANPFSLRWLGGLLLSIAAYFSMASGALTLIAVVVLLSIQIVFRIRPRNGMETASVCFLAVASIVMLAFVTQIPGHDPLKADGFSAFVYAFLQIASWPASKVIFGAVLLNAPIAILFIKILIERRPVDDPAWTAVVVMLWLGTQWLSFAYGRAVAPTASRYLDTYSIGIVINCLAALHLMRARFSKWIGLWFVIGMPFFATAVVTDSGPRAFRGAAGRHANYMIQTENLSAFLKSGDISNLQNKGYLGIPYPDPIKLASIARDPTIRKILPRSLTGKKFEAPSLPKWISGRVRRWQEKLMDGAPILLFLGFAGFACSVLVCRDQGSR